MKKRNILAASDRQPAFSLKDSDGERVGQRSPDVGFLFSRAVIHDKMRLGKLGKPEEIVFKGRLARRRYRSAYFYEVLLCQVRYRDSL